MGTIGRACHSERQQNLDDDDDWYNGIPGEYAWSPNWRRWCHQQLRRRLTKFVRVPVTGIVGIHRQC